MLIRKYLVSRLKGERNVGKLDKYQIVLGCLFIFVLYLGVGNKSEAFDKDPTYELKKIFEVVDEQNIDVDGWQLYSRKQLNSHSTLDKALEQVMEITKQNSSFSWNSPNENEVKRVYKGTLEHPFMTETISIVLTTHNQEYLTYLIYEVNGTKTIRNSWELSSFEIKNRLSDLFRGDSKIFTCVTGNVNDKLNLDLYNKADEIIKSLSAITVEELNEETFISLSAYTELWDTKIETNHKKMNLQVALRKADGLGGKTTITIGTPIITTEY